MIKLRWWSMYLLSCAVGYMLGGVLLFVGQRFTAPVRDLVRKVAIEHADEAAAGEGPYLAPVTAAVFLILATVAGIAVLRWMA